MSPPPSSYPDGGSSRDASGDPEPGPEPPPSRHAQPPEFPVDETPSEDNEAGDRPEREGASQPGSEESQRTGDIPQIAESLPALSSPPAKRPLRAIPSLPQRATPAQMARIAEYYGTRSAAPLGADFSVDRSLDGTAAAVRYVSTGLSAAGISPGLSVIPAGVGAPVAVLEVGISGESIPSKEHSYSRGVLQLTYHTGPGKRLVADTVIHGPYRLSQVSSSDALLRSLRAIPPEVYDQALAFLDDAWLAEVERSGLPYHVESAQPEEAEGFSPIFEIPSRLASYLARYTRLRHHQYTVDPLTGTIRIVYNGDT